MVLLQSSGPLINVHSTTPLADTLPLHYDVSEDNMLGAQNDFITIVGREHVISSFEERRARSNTPWSHADLSQTSALVILPESTSEVSEILKICSRRRVPVTSFSGGTSITGALAATRGGICIDFQRMDKILAVHAEDMDVVVQPCVAWQRLNNHLASQDLYFPPDPGPGARIGGMVSLAVPAIAMQTHSR